MKHLRSIFFASFFFSVHTALLAYANSSMLSQFASPRMVSIVYTLASILSITLVLTAPRILRTLGNRKTIVTTLILSTILLVSLGLASGKIVLLLFVFYFSLNAVVLYGLDIFLEHYSKETQTGNIRGLYLTLSNIGWVAAPIISGILGTRFGFKSLYLVASVVVIATLCIIWFTQKKFVDKHYKKSHLEDGFKTLRTNSNIRTITVINLILQMFFVMMVIYSPLYLTTVIGFSWKTLGILLSIMLVPFVIFPYPAGYIADKYLGEKELLIGGFLIAAAATIFFAQVTTTSFLFFAVILFTSRIGASIVESMSESYFFKQVTDNDSSAISMYRNMLPLAYTVGPLLGALFFSLGSYTLVFSITAGMLVLAAVFTFNLKDSK